MTKAAILLQIDSLISYCERALVASMHPDVSAQLYQFAAQHDLPHLRATCLEFLFGEVLLKDEGQALWDNLMPLLKEDGVKVSVKSPCLGHAKLHSQYTLVHYTMDLDIPWLGP